MALTTADRSRRRHGWLRRVEPELALRLPLESLRPGQAASVPLDLVAQASGAFSTALEIEQGSFRPASAAIERDLAKCFECSFVDGPGGTVALDAVDARSAARKVSRRTPVRKSSSTLRARQPAPEELSLAERLLLVLQPPLEALLEPQGLLEWPDALYPYQYEGVQALVESDALLLADDMGLGKTIQAIAALRVLIHLRRVERAIVVAPASLLSQWRRELERWAPELRVTVVRGQQYERLRLWGARGHIWIVSYETLRQDVDPLSRYGPSAVEWDVAILDEAQKIKNPSTKASQACKSLVRERAWALTGTPLENSIDDLGSIVQFLTPLAVGEKASPLLAGDQLLDRHRELQLRRRKADVLGDLPAKSVNDVWLQLAGEQHASYVRAERDGVVRLRELGEEITISHVLALIQRLKQICNVCPSSGESAKLEDLSTRMEELAGEGQRALVFSQYTADEFGVRGIVTRLAPYSPLAYHGSMSHGEKDGVIQAFKDDARHRALVLSLRAGGQGLNLQEASYVFHFDRWWNPAVERQAEDRAHRMGQKNAVTVYRYICESTIEERIDQILREKQALFDELVDNVSIDPGRLLGEKEIFGLFGLKPPKRGGGSGTEELAA